MGATVRGYPLSAIRVRGTRGEAERVRWRGLMAEHHYLGLGACYGPRVRQVAELPDGTWVALLGWEGGAFKTGARDGWVGWTREQQYRRLHLVAHNSRFLVLPGCSVPNLASRVLGLSVRGLRAEFEARYGHPVLLAETFVDPALFGGACYRAAGWEEAGATRGFARSRGGWEAHGRPKTVLVKPLSPGARGALSGMGEPASWGCGGGPAPAAGRGR